MKDKMVEDLWVEWPAQNPDLVAIGRHGDMKCRGVRIQSSRRVSGTVTDFIDIWPITSRGIGHCAIEIHPDAIPEIVDWLNDYYTWWRANR